MNPLDFLYANYSRYFPEKKKVYLINMSQERDKDQYDSLSGIIVASSGEALDLKVPYSTGQIIAADRLRNMRFKVITESFGLGLQIAADLVKFTADNILRLRPSSVLEAFKHCEMPRIDSTIKVFHNREDSTLSLCKSKFSQLMERKKNGLPLHFEFQENTVNVSASGIRLVSESAEKISPLVLCVLDLEDGQSPICAIAETAWNRRNGTSTISGHRFITILKSDQNRIGRYVVTQQKLMGAKAPVLRNNWVLLDRMTFDSG